MMLNATVDQWGRVIQLEAERWRSESVFRGRMREFHEHYTPILRCLGEAVGPEAAVLEVGSGPTCAARLMPHGNKTYLDPLMPFYRRTMEERLPAAGTLFGKAEEIPRPDAHFDCIVCLDSLDQFGQPAAALREMGRVLRPNGFLLLSSAVYSAHGAALRRYFGRWLPTTGGAPRLRAYTTRTLQKVVQPEFTQDAGWVVREWSDPLLPAKKVREEVWLCRKTAALKTDQTDAIPEVTELRLVTSGQATPANR